MIMSPEKHCYLDYAQSRDPHEPQAFAGTVTLDDVYDYEPETGLTAGQAVRVLGVQGNMWCNVTGSRELLEYMLLPRLAALSEVQWCGPDNKDFARFKSAMNTLRRYYDANGYVYARHLWGIIGLPGHEFYL